MSSNHRFQLRKVASEDVAAMAECRRVDPAGGEPDERMLAYFEGHHHPQHALPPRVGYIAIVGDQIVGYIAGHLTTRLACEGEVQYLYVSSSHRRRGVAAALLRQLARWFRDQGASRVCVNVDVDSPAAPPFYSAMGASAMNRFWYFWEDIDRSLVTEAARVAEANKQRCAGE